MAAADNYEWQLPRAKKQRVLRPPTEPEDSKRLFIPDDIDTLYGTPAIHNENQQLLIGPDMDERWQKPEFAPNAHTMHLKQPFIPDDIDAYFGKSATQNPTRQLSQPIQYSHRTQTRRAPRLSKKSKGARPYIPDDIEAFYRSSDPPEGHQLPCMGGVGSHILSDSNKEPVQQTSCAALPRGVSTRIAPSKYIDVHDQHVANDSVDLVENATVSCFRCGRQLHGERLMQHGEWYHSWCLDQSEPWSREIVDQVAESLSKHTGIERPWLWMQTGLDCAGV